jgi:hypothetical protein
VWSGGKPATVGAAEHPEEHGFGQELDADVAFGGAQGAAQPDFGAAFEYADEHDVADADGADEQGDGAEAEEQAVERAFGGGARDQDVGGSGDSDLVGVFGVRGGGEHLVHGLDLVGAPAPSAPYGATGPVAEAVELLALVAGQDVDQHRDGTYRIARKVARDRIISTVDPHARHEHKSWARTFDGHKGHVGIDPDDDLITNVAVTPANTPDRDMVDELLDEPDDPAPSEAGVGKQLLGDSAYADGATLAKLTDAGHDVPTKVPPVRNANGFSKDRFVIDPHEARSPARRGTPSRSARSGPAGRPASVICAPVARCARRAPGPGPGE